MGFDRIAAALNAEEFQRRTGKRWHGLVVNRILTGVADRVRAEPCRFAARGPISQPMPIRVMFGMVENLPRPHLTP